MSSVPIQPKTLLESHSEDVPSSKLLKLLNIRSNEARVVGQLSVFQFLNGLGVAFFYTAAYSLFVHHFEVDSMSKVYIASFLLFLVFMFIYEKLEHSLNIKKHAFVGISFLATLGLIIRLSMPFFDEGFIFFLLMAMYRLVYTISNLHFWGISAQIFDVRQSKRLFSLVSSGDIPAKMIGYLSISILVPYIGAENLLYFSSFFFAVSLIYVNKITNPKYFIHQHHEKNAHKIHHHKKRASKFSLKVIKSNNFIKAGLKRIINSFFGNSLVFIVAVTAFIVAIVTTLIDFSFLTEIKYKFHSNEEFASYIALLFGIGRAIAILAKILLTGRIANALGTKNSLLLMPLIVLIGSFSLLFVGNINHENTFPLYVFTALVLLVEILKNIFQDPIFLTIFQPLSTHIRLSGHNIVKGKVDPFAVLICGLFLITYQYFKFDFNISYFSIIIIFLCILWIICIFIMEKTYKKVLNDAIKKRFVNTASLNLNDKETIDLFIDKLTIENKPRDIIFSIEMLSKSNIDFEMYLKNLLLSPSDEVKLAVFNILASKKWVNNFDLLFEKLDSFQSIKAKENAVQIVASINQNIAQIEKIKDYAILNHYSNSYLEGLLLNGGVESILEAGNIILDLSRSANSESNILALQIIRNSKIKNFQSPIILLYQSEDKKVKKKAIELMGLIEDEVFIPLLVESLKIPEFSNISQKALISIGDASSRYIINYLVNKKIFKKDNLYFILGEIGSKTSIKFLLSEYKSNSNLLISDALFRSKHSLQVEYIPQSSVLLKNLIESWKEILCLKSEAKKLDNSILISAFENEIYHLRLKLFNLLSITYGYNELQKIKNSIEDGRHLGNSLEYIETLLPNQFSKPLTILLDKISDEEKMSHLKIERKTFNSENNFLKHILQQSLVELNTWTLGASLFLISKHYKKENLKFNNKEFSIEKFKDTPLINELMLHCN